MLNDTAAGFLPGAFGKLIHKEYAVAAVVKVALKGGEQTVDCPLADVACTMPKGLPH